MKSLRNLFVCLIAVFGFTSFSASAAVDPAAPAVQVHPTCDDGAGGTMNNCFDDMGALTSWLKATRRPNEQSPLVVNISAGTFGPITLSGPNYKCDASINYTGYVSFVGAGPGQTTISNGSNPVTVQNCTNLSFSNMTLVAVDYGYVSWSGGGSSTWSNVVVNGKARLWTEGVCGVTRGKHYWFGSRLTASDQFTIANGYAATCDETWIIGSEVLLDVDCKNGDGNSTGGPSGAFIINATNQGEVHVYGSVIRMSAACTTMSGTNLTAVSAGSGGNVHIHGTGIDVISMASNNIRVLTANSGGMIHANASAYNLSTPAGSVTRINNNGGHVHAPYLWEHIPDPATAPNYASLNGADTTTITTGTSDGHPHVAVYSTACPSTARWYDQIDKVCR
jgi:hypothetical protein